MNPKVEIRRAVLDDAAALLALWDEAYAHERSADGIEAVVRALGDDRVACVVAQAEGRVVGSILAAYDGWRGNLYRLAVAPDWRGRGLARQLLNSAHDELRALGAHRVTAIVDPANAPAVRFWRGAGYQFDVDAVRYVGRA